MGKLSVYPRILKLECSVVHNPFCTGKLSRQPHRMLDDRQRSSPKLCTKYGFHRMKISTASRLPYCCRTAAAEPLKVYDLHKLLFYGVSPPFLASR